MREGGSRGGREIVREGDREGGRERREGGREKERKVKNQVIPWILDPKSFRMHCSL